MKKLSSTPLFTAVSILYFLCIAPAKAQKAVKNVQHSIIYHQPGRFAGWPANGGAFLFENDEILVGFTEARYKITNTHNAEKPFLSWLGRSTDGGQTWTTADPAQYVGDFGDTPNLKPVSTPINFKHSGFAMRVVGASYHGAEDGRAHFFYTYDKGKSWQGPFSFGDLFQWKELSNIGLDELSPRTDYIVTSKNECLLFFSVRKANSFGSDRLFCIKTVDRGKSFAFQGWIVGPAGSAGKYTKVKLFDDDSKNPYANECRAVMSQSEKLRDGTLVTMIRRKYVTKDKQELHWIDAYSSTDGGKTWSFTSKVADTGAENGNPPAFTTTKDGRLCVVYGERDHGTIRVVYSADKGKVWSEPQILMDGFWSEDKQLNDLGYPRVVRRKDGKMVAMYYYSTKEHLHHLRASIWTP
ncbi:sialidase family protein [Larkinella arboricola]